MWAVSAHVLLFAVTSLPLAEHWNNPADSERFRVGAGAMVSLGR